MPREEDTCISYISTFAAASGTRAESPQVSPLRPLTTFNAGTQSLGYPKAQSQEHRLWRTPIHSPDNAFLAGDGGLRQSKPPQITAKVNARHGQALLRPNGLAERTIAL